MHGRLLILRQRHRHEDDQDRDHDHQFEQRKARRQQAVGSRQRASLGTSLPPAFCLLPSAVTSHYTSLHLKPARLTLSAHRKRSRLPMMLSPPCRNKSAAPSRLCRSSDRLGSSANILWVWGLLSSRFFRLCPLR